MRQLKTKDKLIISALFLLSLPILAEQYYFDENLAHGSFLNAQTLRRFNNQELILAGKYDLDVFVNNEFKQKLRQVQIKNFGKRSRACLTDEDLINLGIKKSAILQITDACLKDCPALYLRVKGAAEKLDVAQMRLDLTLAQNQLQNNPRGLIDEQDLDAGISMGFANYYANYYHVKNTNANSQNYDSVYLSLNGGINFGLWQYRQNGYLNSNKQNNKQVTTWRNNQSYVQRPLFNLGSNLKIGQLATYGSLLSSINFIGFDLSSDERMQPDSKQGYAPEIRGIASTNAKVSVRQNGVEIYQITVAPGGFVIDDLYPTNFQGDLQVVITEANGEIKTFSVPFAAVPTSIRPNMGIYNLAVGQTNLKHLNEQAAFADLTYQYGLNNLFTLNSGGRISTNYQAFLLGGVFGSSFGALGADITYSNAKMPDNHYRSGYMGHLSYSKTLPKTKTTIALANYRYSSKSYYDLSDILQLREDVKNGSYWANAPYQLLSRFDVSISQSLNKYGYLGIYALTNKYRGNYSEDKQWQLSFGNSFKGLGYSLSYVRQFNKGFEPYNTFSLNLSIPLGKINSYASSSYTKSSKSPAQYAVNLNGSFNNDVNASYGVGINQTQGQNASFNASFAQSLSKADLSLNGSSSNNYWQIGAGLSGSLVIHNGGVTLGHYLGDTFALIEAKGAEGAKVAYNSKIDGKGFALASSLTPYRPNEISIDTYGISYNTEILEGSKTVIPYAGATLKVSFATKIGYGVLIKAVDNFGKPLTFGTEIFDEQDNLLGTVAQGGQLYLRLAYKSGTLKAQITSNKSCSMTYDLPAQDKNSLTKINASCI